MAETRNGHIVDRRTTGGGVTGRQGVYVVKDEDDGRYYSFDYRDIVSDGLRTVRIGEHVRFHLVPGSPGAAEFVIRLNQPDPAEYYR